MQSKLPQLTDNLLHHRGMRHRLVRKRAAPNFSRIDALLAAHVIELLGAVVVRLQRLVGDWPARRDAVDVLDLFEVFAPQPVEHASPELGIAADTVMRVRTELAAALIEPVL